MYTHILTSSQEVLIVLHKVWGQHQGVVAVERWLQLIPLRCPTQNKHRNQFRKRISKGQMYITVSSWAIMDSNSPQPCRTSISQISCELHGLYSSVHIIIEHVQSDQKAILRATPACFHFLRSVTSIIALRLSSASGSVASCDINHLLALIKAPYTVSCFM